LQKRKQTDYQIIVDANQETTVSNGKSFIGDIIGSSASTRKKAESRSLKQPTVPTLMRSKPYFKAALLHEVSSAGKNRKLRKIIAKEIITISRLKPFSIQVH